jgi:hypothetical protein
MVRCCFGACIAVAVVSSVIANPIAFANGTTVTAEYGSGTMQEIQLFYAPRFNYSVGGGHVDFTSDENRQTQRLLH